MRISAYIALASVTIIGGLMGAPAVDRHAVVATMAQAPLSFERVSGGNTRWTARGNGLRVAVGAAEVEVALGQERLRIRFVGANAKAPSNGLDPLPGKLNYFIGRDPKRWLRDIPTYGRVRYKGVYPGADVVWYGNQGRLEYDLELQPGADPGRIAMRFDGALKVAVDQAGDLRVEMEGGSLALKLPVVFQDGARRRERVAASYELRKGGEVGFHLAAYDRSRPLLIDPVLVYASYFGSGFLTMQKMAVDNAGNVYIGGYARTNDSYLPVVNAVQPGNLGNTDAFISKFDPTGKTVLYSTYLGGSGEDFLYGIAVDANGNLAGTGTTWSGDFPVVNGAQATSRQPSAFGFLLNAAGDNLLYSTCLGGSPQATGTGVAVDPAGHAYFIGRPSSSFQTTPGAWNSGGSLDTYVIKLSNTGSQQYAALIPGQVSAIAVDSQGAAYVAGSGAHALVSKLSSDATSLVWTASLGGNGTDSANAIALGQGGVVYFGGQTTSSDLPVTSGAIQPACSGGQDAFVASLSADGSSFGFVTYLGGSSWDALASLAVDANGQLIVAGNTLSPDFPVSSALQPAFPAPPNLLFKSTNSGLSFTPADTGLPRPPGGFGGGQVLPDPSVAGTLIVGTKGGIFRSTDDGETWNKVSSSVGTITRSLSNPSVLYQQAPSTLLKSADGGQTWNPTTGGGTLSSVWWQTTVGISPTDPNTIVIPGSSAWNSGYRSTNGGSSFASVVFPFGSTMPFWSNLQITSSPDGSMYAYTLAFDGGWTELWGIYRSGDAGLTWTRLQNGAPATVGGFALSPSTPAEIYASDCSNVYMSSNAGGQWTTVAAGANVCQLAADPSTPQKLYGLARGRGQVVASTDGGATWNPTGGFVETVASGQQGIAVTPASPAELYLLNASSYGPASSGFAAKLSNDGTTLTWSTYYGSYSGTSVAGAAAEPSGQTWIAGIDQRMSSASTAGGLPLTPDGQDRNTATGAAFIALVADAAAPCSYSINPAIQYDHGSPFALPLSVTAPTGCAWTAAPSDPWIHLTRTSGAGSGTIPVWVDPNTTAATRTGTVSVNGQDYTIVQAAANCTFQVSNPTLTSAGGDATITVTAPDGCPWDVQLQSGDPAWITSPATGTGNGTVTLSVPANASVNDLSFRASIGTAAATITEWNACVFTFPDGTDVTVAAPGASRSIQIAADLNGCAWNASSDQTWLQTYVGSSPYGSGTLDYSVSANTTGVNRTAHVTVGHQQIAVTQLAPAPTAVFRDAIGSIRLSTYGSSTLSNSGGIFASDPSAAQDSNGNTFVAARDTYNALWVNVYHPSSSTWSGWQFGGGVIQGVPAITVDSAGTAWIGMRDTFNSYWLLSYTQASGFGSWIYLAGIFSTDPVVAASRYGTIHIVGKDTWNSLWSGWYYPGSQFLWRYGGGIVRGKPSLAMGTDGYEYIGVRDTWDSLWMARVDGNGWQWSYGGGIMSNDPQVAASGDGTIYTLLLDSGNVAWYIGRGEGASGTWQTWTQTGGVVQNLSPAALGPLYAIGRDPNDNLWWYRSMDSLWTYIGNQGVAAGPLAAARW